MAITGPEIRFHQVRWTGRRIVLSWRTADQVLATSQKFLVAGARCDARLEAPRWPIGRPGESHDQIASSVGHWHARRASGRFYLRLRTIEVGGPFKAMVAKQDVWTEAVTITVAPP